ncbi:replication endonuclease [Neptunicella sp. SCSIO 80796]|uniref:replication endonuclease n=1 Tax=Neptunicella plasticusilytica TaxID=3117012 RepID=UPI003A4E0061
MPDLTINTFQREYDANKAFVDNLTKGLPPHIRKKLLREYIKRYNSKSAQNPQRSANIYIRQATELLRDIIADCPFQDYKSLYRAEALEAEAKAASDHCLKLLNLAADDADQDSYEFRIYRISTKLAQYAVDYGIKPPFNEEKADLEQRESAILRMVSDGWWLRKFSRMRDQFNEFINIGAGIVKKGTQPYLSNQSLQEWRQQRRANQLYLESMEVVNEETEQRISLAEIAAATTANPEKRRIELMVRCRGLEELADDYGYQAFFVTWTAPSKYHRNSEKWNRSKPNETQQYLCNQWAKCRAKIDRNEIQWFGVRVAEPHADATPHWHMLLFCRPEDAREIQSIMREYATQHERSELIEAHKNRAFKMKFEGWRRRKPVKYWYEPRIKIEYIDPELGSATGYIAKYISKNINANHIGTESDFETKSDLQTSVDRVAGWASRWNLRQFQFFGAAPVTVWRECRRLKGSAEHEALERVRLAADSSKWCEFTKLLDENPVGVLYDISEKNKFNEPIKKVIGLLCYNIQELTRLVKFRLEKKQGNALLSGDSRASWSTVNNCTRIHDNAATVPNIPDFIPINTDSLPRFYAGNDTGDDYEGF